MIAIGIIIILVVAFAVTASALLLIIWYEENRKSDKPELWLVTGEVWGSHIYANSRKEAKELFLARYPQERILTVKKKLQPKDAIQ